MKISQIAQRGNAAPLARAVFQQPAKAEKHRTLIPSYRDIRFPVIQLADGDRPRKILYHALAMVIAWLHEATKTGGLRSRIIALKNRYREIRPKRA